MNKLLQNIIDKSRLLGTPLADIATAKEFLENRELGLCLDTLITQMYEEGIVIDKMFYQLVVEAAEKMGMPIKEVDLIKELLP